MHVRYDVGLQVSPYCISRLRKIIESESISLSCDKAIAITVLHSCIAARFDNVIFVAFDKAKLGPKDESKAVDKFSKQR